MTALCTAQLWKKYIFSSFIFVQSSIATRLGSKLPLSPLSLSLSLSLHPHTPQPRNHRFSCLIDETRKMKTKNPTPAVAFFKTKLNLHVTAKTLRLMMFFKSLYLLSL